MPTIVTDVPFTVDLSAGEAIVILGFAVSRTYVTIGDGSLAPPGSTTVAVKSLMSISLFGRNPGSV